MNGVENVWVSCLLLLFIVAGSSVLLEVGIMVVLLFVIVLLVVLVGLALDVERLVVLDVMGLLVVML